MKACHEEPNVSGSDSFKGFAELVPSKLFKALADPNRVALLAM